MIVARQYLLGRGGGGGGGGGFGRGILLIFHIVFGEVRLGMFQPPPIFAKHFVQSL